MSARDLRKGPGVDRTRTYLGWVAVAGDAFFIAWLLFNGMDEGWRATPMQIASYGALIALLALNAVLLARSSR